jgi:hypothetical protein
MAMAHGGEILGFLDPDYKTEIDELSRVLPLYDRGIEVVAGSGAVPESRIDRYQPHCRELVRACSAWQRMPPRTETHNAGSCFSRAPAAAQIFERTQIDRHMCDDL